MVSYLDIEEQIESLDVNILSLLVDRSKLISTLDESVSPDTVADTVAFWIEEAEERGLNEVVIERLSKLVILSSQKNEE
jgi:hypothetical protein